MSTRADFYIGTGETAEWLGSIAFDGYRIDDVELEHLERRDNSEADLATCWDIKHAADEASFRRSVADLLALNDDATTPDKGWPWPWDSSRSTDYVYAFVDGACKTFQYGKGAEWPNMKGRRT